MFGYLKNAIFLWFHKKLITHLQYGFSQWTYTFCKKNKIYKFTT